MKKVLIIAHLLRASPRIPGLAKYLPEFGWQPIVLTAPLDGKPDGSFRTVETGYRETLGFWKKVFKIDPNQDDRTQLKERLGITSQRSVIDFVLTCIGEIVNYPDSDKGWRGFAIKTGSEIIGGEGIAAIISSSSPVTSHIVAKELKLKHQLPWLADLRDLWSQNHNYSYSSLRKWFDRRQELGTLSTADALVTVSQPWADELSSLHRKKATYAITNGFDPETENTSPESLSAKFTITYTGTIYAGKQTPWKLFAALRNLISEGIIIRDDISVRFYGAEVSWLSEQIAEYGLSDVAESYERVSQQVALERQRESQVLLLLNWDDEKILGWHPLKGFEYLAARRPILAVGGSGDDVTKKLLEETNAGTYCKTVVEIEAALRKLYSEYKLTGKVDYDGCNNKNISKYSHREMARKFSGILHDLTGG